MSIFLSSTRRSHLSLRLCVRTLTIMLLLCIGGTNLAQAQTSPMYVITYGSNYLRCSGSSLGATSTFDPSTCIWTCSGTLGSSSLESLSIGNQHLAGTTTNGGALSVTTSTGTATSNWRINTTNNLYYYYYYSAWYQYQYYVYYNNGFFSSSKSSTYRNKQAIADPVTRSTIAAQQTIPTINGDDEISSTTYTFTHSNAVYQEGYTNYYFAGANHYFTTAGASFSNLQPATITSYSWSLTPNSYATVDNITGTMTVNSLPTQDVPLTLTLTATYSGGTPAATGTMTATKQITLLSVHPPQISRSDDTISLTSDNTNDAIFYTLDGSTPSNSSTLYSAPIILTQSPSTIKAITYRNGFTSTISTETFYLICATPVITDNGDGNFTISNPTNATTYYTTDGSTPTTSSPSTTAAITLSIAPGTYIQAFATRPGYLPSEITTTWRQFVGAGSLANNPYLISSVGGLSYMASHPSDYYKVATDFNASSFSTDISNFSGQLDGNYKTISGLSRPLFSSTNGATVKNLKLAEVHINGASNIGAITGTASGATRIYNCGVLNTYNPDGSVASQSTISGTNNVGSLVGSLQNTSRVINCYSFADVTGTGTCAGIVGYNNGTSTSTSITTQVMNCMFYGTVSGGTNFPIYGGTEISNVNGINTFNYFRLLDQPDAASLALKCALPIEKDAFLTRFEFFRNTLNAERKLAAYYCLDNVSKKDSIGKWVLDPQIAPFPIIKAPEHNTQKTLARTIPSTTNNFAGKQVGSVNVTISINSTNFNQTLPITDMDTARHDYTYGKILLPFANEFSGWTPQTTTSTIKDKIIVGWEITTLTGGTNGSLTDYDFCNPDCTNKDRYANSGYVYAQGSNFVVPNGVTAITITAHWADAVYLRDPSYDISYANDYSNPTNLGGSAAGTYNGKTIQTSLSTALTQLSTVGDVFSQAIVLVGNFHYNQKVLGNVFDSYTNRPLTIMSIDEDNDQEPDYCWFSYHTTDRTDIAPVRFDFMTNAGIGMVARVSNSTAVPTIGIWHSHGWFETTQTYLGRHNETEINSSSFTSSSPWIINGGYFDQVVTCRDGNSNKSSYFIIGGNAYVNQFHPGTHDDNNYTTTICPVNVRGGEIVECYMTGRKSDAPTIGSVRFYCNGGYLHTYLGSYMAQVNGDVTTKIDHAIIDNFYGGGANSNKPITGNISNTINNSYVKFFCAGPKFGNMATSKTVTTNATHSTFGEYYGAGYGGTCYTRDRVGQNAGVSFNANKSFFDLLSYSDNFVNNNHRLYFNSNFGTGARTSYEYFFYAGGSQGVARFYVEYATLSLAQTNKVISNLTNCTVLSNFYGGGCQGRVDNSTESTLMNCHIAGSAFGGGYTANVSTIQVYSTTAPTSSVYTKSLGVFSDFGDHSFESYTWVTGNDGSVNGTAKTIGTTIDMTTMGEITQSTNITIDGGIVEGNVFGGGNKSKVLQNTNVVIKNGATINGNVYGGGNQAVVNGTTNVQIGE